VTKPFSDRVQRATFQWFLDCQNHDTGLIFDRTRPGCPATIAGVGFALTAYPVAVNRGWLNSRRRFAYAGQGLARSRPMLLRATARAAASGYRGFFYTFLDPATGLRATAPTSGFGAFHDRHGLVMAGVSFRSHLLRKRMRWRKRSALSARRCWSGSTGVMIRQDHENP